MQDPKRVAPATACVACTSRALCGAAGGVAGAAFRAAEARAWAAGDSGRTQELSGSGGAIGTTRMGTGTGTGICTYTRTGACCGANGILGTVVTTLVVRTAGFVAATLTDVATVGTAACRSDGFHDVIWLWPALCVLSCLR